MYMTEKQWRKKFADVVINKMSNISISAKELSDRTGVSQASMSRYLNCQRTPTIITIANIANVLGSSIDELINFGEIVE